MKIQKNVSNGIGELVFEHPPVNALGPNEMASLADAVASMSNHPDVRVLLMYSKGRGFCAGIDIKALAEESGLISRFNRSAFGLFEAIHLCAIPVVTAVHGFALGAGAAMAGASDVLFAARGARFGLPEIKVGMLGGASHMLRILPLSKVRSMYFTGEPIDAEEMYRLGAVEQVVEPDDLVGAARDYAAQVAVHSATGLRFAKEALNGIEPVRLETNYRYEQGFTFEISHLEAGQEAREKFAGTGSSAQDPAERNR